MFCATRAGMQAGMLNPFGGGMGSPTPLSNQMMMMNQASSPVMGYGQGIDAMPQYGVCVWMGGWVGDAVMTVR